MTALTSFTRRLALMIAALMLIVFFTNTAEAQNEPLNLAEAKHDVETIVASMLAPNPAKAPRFKVSSRWIENADQQFAQALHTAIDEVRANTLKNIIYLATFQGDLFPFNATVPALVDIYRLDDVEAHRLMAVQALYAIGDGYGMQRLREEAMSQESARVRAATQAALIEYEASH